MPSQPPPDVDPTTEDSLEKLDPEAEAPEGSKLTAAAPPEVKPPALRQINGAQMTLLVLGTIAFLYFSRPVTLPVVLAWMCATALRPLVRWLTALKLPTPVAAAVVFCLLLAVMVFGVFQIERPAVKWLNEAPQHMTTIRHRFLRLFPKALHLPEATEAVTQLGETTADKKPQDGVPVVEVRQQPRGPGPILNWTGTLLGGLGEVLVLSYLLLAAGDLFLQKVVRVTPTLRGKIQAVEISHEIQQNISTYLFSISLINIALGTLLGLGLSLMGVPNAVMWGVLAAVLNFVPYFGPICGVILLAAVGLLTFDNPLQGLLPPGLYLILHLIESNLVTPILLGKRFTLNPVAIFVSLMFWLWLWGIPGALLAVPVLVSVKVVCDRIPALSYLGELIGR
jgi:predicted PurR-regulated permease PerM